MTRRHRFVGRAGPVIVVAALLTAFSAAPATADPFGEPFRVTFTGADSDATKKSINPSFAYNSQTHQYLAVWSVDTGTGPTVVGQLRDSVGGPVGSVFPVSDPGPACTPDPNNSSTCGHEDPIVDYNPDANEFYVVWHRISDTTGSNCIDTSGNSSDIRAQRISAAGAQVGPHDQLISSTSLCARDPQMRYSTTSKRYLVTWSNEGNNQPIQVFAQVVASNGVPMSASEIQVSDNSGMDNSEVGLAWDSANDHWLVVWGREKGNSGIAGQLLDASGALVGGNFDISGLNPSSNPSAVFNAKDKQFLVAWRREVSDSASSHDIRGQLLSPDGTKVGTNDFRIDNGAAIDNDAVTNDAVDPSLAWDSTGDQYEVAWQSNTGPSIQGQTLAADGSLIGTHGFAISNNADDEEPRTLVYNPNMCEYLVGWEGSFSSSKVDIFARRLAGFPCADLALTNSAAPTTVIAGRNITYTIKVTNAGPSPTPNTHVGNGLPAATTLVSVTASQGACPNAPALTCDLGTVAPGSTVTVSYIVRSSQPGTVRDTATVSSDVADSTPADNTATATATVTAVPAVVKKPVLLPACSTKRRFRVHARAPVGVRLVASAITVNGHRVRASNRHGFSALIRLPQTASRRVTVKIISTTSTGRRIREVRHYRICRIGRHHVLPGLKRHRKAR